MVSFVSGSLIFSVIGKKKKAGKVSSGTASPRQIEKEVIDDNSLQQSFSGLFHTHVAEKPEKHILRKPESKPVNKFTGSSVIIESEEDENPLFSFEEEDDVVRAIIYSEIINRKEY